MQSSILVFLCINNFSPSLSLIPWEFSYYQVAKPPIPALLTPIVTFFPLSGAQPAKLFDEEKKSVLNFIDGVMGRLKRTLPEQTFWNL